MSEASLEMILAGLRASHECVLGLQLADGALQVATQRVKTAQKAEIPHIDEPVSKIENVGVQTQNKLQDIKAAAEQIGVHGLSVVHNCITTGQWVIFIHLHDCCESSKLCNGQTPFTFMLSFLQFNFGIVWAMALLIAGIAGPSTLSIYTWLGVACCIITY